MRTATLTRLRFELGNRFHLDHGGGRPRRPLHPTPASRRTMVLQYLARFAVMRCESPPVATGSKAGYLRHWRANEAACDDCRLANTAHSRQQKRANPERSRASAKKSYWKHHEKNLLRNRRWYAQHTEDNKQRGQAFRQANPGYQAEWRQRNPDKARAIDFRRETNRRHRLDSVLTIPFTAEQLMSRLAYWGNRCWLCGAHADTVDHVKPLSAGGAHILANLRPACRSCNATKRTQWPYDTAKRGGLYA